MTNKHEVIDLNRRHPEWSVRDIADALGCMPQYVSATGRRNGLKFAPGKAGPVSAGSRTLAASLKSEISAALFDISCMRSAIAQGEPQASLLRRCDELKSSLSEALQP